MRVDKRCFEGCGALPAQLGYLVEEADFEFDTFELEAAFLGAEVAELGQTAHEFEVKGGVFVQIVGKEAGIECTEDLVNGSGEIGFGCGFAELVLGFFFEPSLVGAQTPAGNVMACDAGVAAFGEGGGDFCVGAVVEEEVVDEIADCGGEIK